MSKFFIIFFIFFTISPLASYCQECEPMDPWGCEEDPDLPLPIDSGVSLLLGAGALYAFKNLKGKKKSETNGISD